MSRDIAIPTKWPASDDSDQPSKLIKGFAFRQDVLNPWLPTRCPVTVYIIHGLLYSYAFDNFQNVTFYMALYSRHITKVCHDLLQTLFITKTRLFKYTENFTTKKKWKFSDKNSDIFHMSAQNTDCGYSLEPPRRGGSNEYQQSMFLSRNKKNSVPL